MTNTVGAVIAALALLSACSSAGHPSSRPVTTTTAIPSLTPRVTTGSAAERLAGALLTTSDLQAVPGAPRDVHAVPVNDVGIFRDPDPRSPCGQRLAQPDPTGAAGIAIQGTGLGGFEFVFPETVAAATAYVNAVQADTRPKCAAYQTRTNTGTLQTVTLLTPVALPNVGDQATGALLRIVGRAQGTYVFEAVLRAGAQLAITVVLATSLPTPEFLRAVAGRAATRLRSAIGP